MHGGRGRTRTGTPVSQKQILSLLCLPFHHAAYGHFLHFRRSMSHLCRTHGYLRVNSASKCFSGPKPARLASVSCISARRSCMALSLRSIKWKHRTTDANRK